MKNNSRLLNNRNTQLASYLRVSSRPLMELDSLGTGKETDVSVTEDLCTYLTKLSQNPAAIEKQLTYYERELEFLKKDLVPTTFWRTYANYANIIIGTGVMALPYTILVGGLSAPLLMVHAAWAAMKSAQLLAKCFYEDGDPGKKQVRFNFKHIACDAFGSSGYILDILSSFTNLTSVSIRLILCAEVLESISPVFERLRWLLVCATIILMEALLLPNLDKLSWLNRLGLLNVLFCIVTVLVVSMAKIVRYPGLLWAGFTSYKIFDWRGAFVANNISIFMMACVLVPSIFCEMKDKFKFDELSRLVYITIVICQQAFAFIAFFAFQEDTADAVILNIDSLSVRMVVSITIVVDQLVTTPSVLYPVRLQIESILPYPKTKTTVVLTYFYRSVNTTVLLAICIALAISVPNFAVLASITGSILYTTLIYILPVVCWQLLTRNKSMLDMAKGSWIIVTSVVSLVGGVCQNIQAWDS